METPSQKLIQRLCEMGYTKWRIMKLMQPIPPKTKLTYRTVDAWSRGEWNPKPHFFAQLVDLYIERCRTLGVGLYEGINSNTEKKKEK